ncbi:alpha/beta fold hydrolase [Rhizobium sp. BR 314]|uniref:alpha/beta fold hydrolase n=1 Tax=Rhizobium sp. BR 314 TaxID=3040013 RepID=UPI0039BF920E
MMIQPSFAEGRTWRPNVTAEWTGLLPVEDTALAVSDLGGHSVPVVYLNGSFADQSRWRKVVADLGPNWRHILYDERARGRSKRSADYSFEACIRDLDAVLGARGVNRALLVGWSYGAYIGVQWAARNPDRALGVVAVEGAFPWGWIEAAGHERIRTLFRWMRLLLPIASRLGVAAHMSAEQHAEITIENHKVAAAFDPVLDDIRVPVRYVLATGASLCGCEEEFRAMRESIIPALARNRYLKVSAKVASNHRTILHKDFRAIAEAVREIASMPPIGAFGASR